MKALPAGFLESVNPGGMSGLRKGLGLFWLFVLAMLKI